MAENNTNPTPKASAIFLVGATGAGKSSQIATLLDLQGIKPIVFCFDPGSVQSHRVNGVEMGDLMPIREILAKYPADKYLRIIDSWPGYESWTIMGQKARPAGNAWQKIVGGYRDDIHAAYAASNVVIVGNISDGEKVVQSLDSEGKRASAVIARGALVCTPALQQPPLLAQMAPVVLPVSSGGDRFGRSWVAGQLGQVAMKYAARGDDGKPTFLLPNASPGQKMVPVDACTLKDIYVSLTR